MDDKNYLIDPLRQEIYCLSAHDAKLLDEGLSEIVRAHLAGTNWQWSQGIKDEPVDAFLELAKKDAALYSMSLIRAYGCLLDTLDEQDAGLLAREEYWMDSKVSHTPEIDLLLTNSNRIALIYMLHSLLNYAPRLEADEWVALVDLFRRDLCFYGYEKISFFAIRGMCNHFEPKHEGLVKALTHCIETKLDDLYSFSYADVKRGLKTLIEHQLPHPLQLSIFMRELLLSRRENDVAKTTIFELCQQAKTARPNAKWIKNATTMLKDKSLRKEIYQLIDTCFVTLDPKPLGNISLTEEEINKALEYHWTPNDDPLRGLVWLAGMTEDDAILRKLSALANSAYKKKPGVGPRAVKVGNACIQALSAAPGEVALAQLALLKSRTKFRTALNLIAKALSTKAQEMGVSVEEVEEISVPGFGIEEVGHHEERLGEHSALLDVEASDKILLTWRNETTGKIQKSIPAAVKQHFADDLKDIRALSKDMLSVLSAQKSRLDGMYLLGRKRDFKTWHQHYHEHPLVGCLAHRLIWRFTENKTVQDLIWTDEGYIDHMGKNVKTPSKKAEVSLWHPIDSPAAEVLAWRQLLIEHQIKQPFKQAHREIYLLTPAEEQTGVYSNRFAGHILRQHQFNALCLARGWRNQLRLMVDDEYAPAHRLIERCNLRADYWVEGIGEEYGTDTNEQGTYLYLNTDQLRFYPADAATRTAHASGGGYTTGVSEDEAESDEPLRLEQIQPLVFSEIMRDVDLFVGVASVGNDPNWLDHGPEERQRDYWNNYSFGGLSQTAETRKELLQSLIPRLKISAPCSFEDRFLIVQGKLTKYKIHLGSGNILMAPNDRYLCIVQKQSVAAKVSDKVFLPFEGDRTLAVIISKAFMLADDHKIKDISILDQINQNG